jgi:hypothetical protein
MIAAPSQPTWRRGSFNAQLASFKPMSSNTIKFLAAACAAIAPGVASAAKPAGFALMAHRQAGDQIEATVTLEVGGELVVADEKGREKRLPMSVAAKSAYRERLLSWPVNAAGSARSLRQYSEAQATIKGDGAGTDLVLPEEVQTIVAELAPEGVAIAGLDQPLSREQFDLVNILGNTLAIDRLLPNKTVAEGEGWDHDAATIGPLLGMDHVAVCEVQSVVTGEESRQVKIRLAGTVHGTVDGAASEMELRGAYLYHVDVGRITKMNLTVKEVRKAGEATPGLDVSAKLTLVAASVPRDAPSPFDDANVERAEAKSPLELQQLLVNAPSRGYRFCHDSSWFVTAEARELMSLRQLERGDLLAHCNVTTMPPRSPEKPLGLEAFQQDVGKALGDKLEKIEAATEWETPTGCRALGVLANGTVEDVPVQWRYYHLSDAAGRQATIAVTVEQSLLERFADGDRPIVDSMELTDQPAGARKTTATAAAEEGTAKK